MSSGTEIITAALQKIGAHSVASPASPEAIVDAKSILNSMLQMWQSDRIDMGVVPLDAPGDELSEPMDAKLGIIYNLAIMLAPDFSNGKQVVSPELSRGARIGYTFIKKMYQPVVIPQKKVSSTMPMGAGSTRGVWRSTFVDQDRELED
jgi:hypothetical protein